RQLAQNQEKLGEGQLDHEPQSQWQEQRAGEHDQQGGQARQHGERGPQRYGSGQQVARGGEQAAAAGVEEENQGGAIEGVENQPDQQFVGWRVGRPGQAGHQGAHQAFGSDQRQAQRGDAGQVASEEQEGVTQNTERIHQQASWQYACAHFSR